MKRNDWLYTILPISAVSSGFSVLIPLYILSLGGNVFDVGVALTLFNVFEVPASLFWGRLTDRLHRNKELIILSVVGILPVFAILFFLQYVGVAEVMYGVYAFIATAASPAINIMIIGKRRDGSLPRYYSRYSMLAIFGGLIALIPGIGLTEKTLYYYLLLLLVIDVFGIFFAFKLIKPDKPVAASQAKEAKKSFALLNMLSPTPFILTGINMLKRTIKEVRLKKNRQIYLILAAMSMFNLGLYLFNTSYIPFLNRNGIGYGGIFLINIANSVGQLFVYGAVMFSIKRFKIKFFYRLASLIRSFGYLIAFLPVILISAYIFYFNVFAYFTAGVGYSLWNVASSVVLYTHIRNRKEGKYIGIWIAVLGTSAIVGSFASGLLSYYVGYIETFIVAIALTIISILIFSIENRADPKVNDILK